jgi:hypothetical protein
LTSPCHAHFLFSWKSPKETMWIVRLRAANQLPPGQVNFYQTDSLAEFCAQFSNFCCCLKGRPGSWG